jgi:hypothetical protein
MNIPQDSHPRWIGTMTPLLPSLRDYFMIFIRGSLFIF